MTIEKVFPSGAWQISGVIEREGEREGYFLSRTYYGYTKKEAIKLWRQHIAEKAL
jgi:hypothetical protein